LNAANSYESRTPFLDAGVMDFALKIPLNRKIHGEEQTGKWILRRAFEGVLPEHIIYQTKRFFAQGSGVAYIMRRLAEQSISEDALKAFNAAEGNPFLASVEELYYYRIFKESLPHPTFDRLVGRWDPMRPAFFSEWATPHPERGTPVPDPPPLRETGRRRQTDPGPGNGPFPGITVDPHGHRDGNRNLP
jgi:hypothetical protein